MHRRSRLLTLAVTNVLVTVSATVGVASSTADERSRSSGHRSPPAVDPALAVSVALGAAAVPGKEYVVAFEGDAEAARKRMQSAGGRVVEVLPEIGLARVRAPGDSFLDVVRRQDGIVGAARNHAVGTSRPGMPHRFAEERPPTARATVAGPGGAQSERPPHAFPGRGHAGRPRQLPPSLTLPSLPLQPPPRPPVIPPRLPPPPEKGPEMPPWLTIPSLPPMPSIPKLPAPPVRRERSWPTDPPAVPVPPSGRVTRERSAPSTGTSTRLGSGGAVAPVPVPPATDPLVPRQWNMRMIGATSEAAHRQATGAGVEVGLIDTGVDGQHPDIAPNLDRKRSRNFTVDRPETDGNCEVASCVDPPDVDHHGHGTHVAATLAGARNGFGIVGVAPEARLVSLRAGQDSGYFFVYEVAEALVTAADMGLDIVNMSFFTDPWLYNCRSRDDYLEGEVTDDELAQQRLIREVMVNALEHAHDRGVTLVAAAGNSHADLAAPQRVDTTSPGYPPGNAKPRTVRRSCLDLPVEGPHVLAVGAVGPSGIKADYSNYGKDSIELVAPGGWLEDRPGTPPHGTPDNLVLSAYPLAAAIEQRLARPDGQPSDAFSVRHCDAAGTCGFYTTMQGTSMATPHVSGVAALVIERLGRKQGGGGARLDPDRVARILASTAADRACPPGGTQDYATSGRGPEWSAACEGTTAANGLYGEGLVSASRAVNQPASWGRDRQARR